MNFTHLEPPADFIEGNRACIDLLLERHPDKSEQVVAKALWIAQALSEAPNHQRIVAAASMALDQEV